MAMEVHIARGCDMDCCIKECAQFSHDKIFKNHLPLSFCIHFFREHVNITFQYALIFVIKRKIKLMSDACSKPPITIRSHNLHVGDIRRLVGDIASYHHERD